MLGIILAAIIIGCSSVLILHLPDDNPIEEIAEDVIELETGLDVDLTPGSLEHCARCEDAKVGQKTPN